MGNDSGLLLCLIEAVQRAGKIVREYFESATLQVSRKTASYDLVTPADRESEGIIVTLLERFFPNIPVIGEERGLRTTYPEAFYVDPLDGTFNFACGLPFFAVSIGYWRDGEPLLGVVYDPLREDLFWAQSGEGAFLNGERIQVSSIENLEGSALVTGIPYRKERLPVAIQTIELIIEVTDFRVLGSASLNLCYLARGVFDGYWEYDLAPWDLAAGVVIAREAGARITDPSGEPFVLARGDVLAATPGIHEDLVRILARGHEGTMASQR